MQCNGQRIKAVRLLRGLTLKEVAAAIGVQEATIQRYESGRIKDIPDEKVCALSETLDTSAEYLMGIGSDSDNLGGADQFVDWLLQPSDAAGNNIKKLRKERGLSVEELAHQVQVSRQTIYRYESGKLGNMSPGTASRLAKSLHTSVAYIIGKTDDPDDISPSVLSIDALYEKWNDASLESLKKEIDLFKIQSRAEDLRQESEVQKKTRPDKSELDAAINEAMNRHIEVVKEMCIKPECRPDAIPNRINAATEYLLHGQWYIDGEGGGRID